MEKDLAKFIGGWKNEAGNVLLIEGKTDERMSVSFLRGTDRLPVSRPFHGNRPSTAMDGRFRDWGSTLEVELWEEGKGFSLHLTFERAYELDEQLCDSLVPALSRNVGDAFLDEHYSLFEPLKHYTREDRRTKR